jgi:hypothetical protein
MRNNLGIIKTNLKLNKNQLKLRACLAGLRLHHTHFGAAAPPICSSTVELDSQFGAEEMCLAEITAPTPETMIVL